MKSFWIFCAGRRSVFGPVAVTLLAAVVWSALPLSAARGKEPSIEDLTNFLLGPGYSQWLVGPVSRLATKAETDEYLRLTSDEAAAEFIEAFWRRRDDPARPWPQEQVQGVFERRAAEADRLYTEGTTLGRRTDRGETHILFGPPARVEYAPVSPPRRGTIEIWYYPKDAETGLTDQKPRPEYYFLQKGETTVSYIPSVRDLRGPGRGR